MAQEFPLVVVEEKRVIACSGCSIIQAKSPSRPVPVNLLLMIVMGVDVLILERT